VIVLITAQAEADLERIGDYIAEDNPQRAASFIQELLERCERLAEHRTVFHWFHVTNTPAFAAVLTATI
jgi:plasmid stabilization system protein ParE